MTFIGRWCPFHRGHIAIIEKKRSECPGVPVMMMVRDTQTDEYPAVIRAEYIKLWMVEHNIKGTIMIVPNIEGVYWGRDVGYHVGKIDVDMQYEKISGTKIRKNIHQGSKQWERIVASKKTASMLMPSMAPILSSGLVVWLTGCPSSGKTTIATALESEVRKQYPYLKIMRLDGDDMRTSPLASHVGFTKKDRADHIRRMAYIAKMFADCGVLVICSFVSPDRSVRHEVRKMIGSKRFVEVYVRAKKQTRLARDVKGLYTKAQMGRLINLTGYNAPYQPPNKPEAICDTDALSVEECVSLLLESITTRS